MNGARRLACCLVPLCAACAPLPAAEESPRDAASLAAAERAFAAQSVRDGMRTAFLHWLAPGATLFRGGPVDGIATIAAAPDPPIELDWRPAYVETSAAGDLGLSTGPWTIRPRAEGAAPARFGQFVSVWRRAQDGEWRVHVDLGISHPEPSLREAPTSLNRVAPPEPRHRQALAEAEAAFAEQSRAIGARAAYAAWASASIRGYRETLAPLLGKDAFLASAASPPRPLDWQAQRTETSLSADLGFAIGRFAAPAGAAGHYLRVWRHEGTGWRIALDITEPLPP